MAGATRKSLRNILRQPIKVKPSIDIEKLRAYIESELNALVLGSDSKLNREEVARSLLGHYRAFFAALNAKGLEVWRELETYGHYRQYIQDALGVGLIDVDPIYIPDDEIQDIERVLEEISQDSQGGTAWHADRSGSQRSEAMRGPSAPTLAITGPSNRFGAMNIPGIVLNSIPVPDLDE